LGFQAESRAPAKLRAAIAGTGAYLPERRLTNADLEKLVETSDQWIIERTGIHERRIAAPHETTSSMAIEAARRACESASFDPRDLDLVLVATATPDYVFPATACLVQHALGATKAGAFDLQAACSGFLYATSMASAMVAAGQHRHVMVIGAETLSRIVDYTDRSTCILFGDGAGSIILSPSRTGAGVLHTKVGADGSQAELLRLPAGGSKLPASAATVAAGQHYMQIEGRRVFKFATTVFIELVEEAMQTCGLSRDDVKLIVPHQVNERIIDAAMRKLDLPPEKFFINIDRYGNTSAASVPIALHEARQQGRLAPGDIAIMLAFGAGLTWSSAVVRM
jgi:3-oxoacyl-[acyl-carrier-protein] synthase-3